jgi:hypothetical protein
VAETERDKNKNIKKRKRLFRRYKMDKKENVDRVIE